eukprot:CAMPEP_0174369076 /NCGR_PEP_ID=MMETSP0811_2-20130205/91251_1 /TAXON_ID=73025 ORGANISM="Eutreptiella gymnastica-like, Strain CCMP1594" /NCGR_SAMPLE_ID=MMETSP0811_2 /ASSEMBLY_ACC=CAM_ASM_000667 /LENGTH=84 /DNA_ID=CAMNT_0015513159 /DNA_START=90 /DNA_END=341 /DNA_ORIENTATION=-
MAEAGLGYQSQNLKEMFWVWTLDLWGRAWAPAEAEQDLEAWTPLVMGWGLADCGIDRPALEGGVPPPPPCVTFRRVAVSLRGPG